jgi:hypothetical protein
VALLPAVAPARTPDNVCEQAEAAFNEGIRLAANRPNDARGCFGCAAALYEKVYDNGAANPALFRNLGNAYILARENDNPQDDSLARAILAYRQGLRLDPSDRALQRHLEFARQQVIYPPPGTFGVPPVEHRPPWLPRWPGLLLALAAASYSFAWLALARWYMVRSSNWLTVTVCLGIAMALFLAAFGVEVWQIRDEARHRVAVIARDDVRLLVGNGPRYPARYETALNRGVEARVRHDKGRWLQIELSGGEIGWVPRSAVLVDTP